MTRWLTMALLITVAAGCTGTERERKTLRVFAASSMTEAFRAAERSFEAANPGIDVQLSFAGSQRLRLQIAGGAPADVFVSADAAHVDALDQEGLVASRRPLARNALSVIVPTHNPGDIRRFGDLGEAARIVVGSTEAPIGRYTARLLDAAGADFAARVRAAVVSRETNVRLVRAKVALGEADAAIVYRSDARGGDVRTVPIPEHLMVSTQVHAAILGNGGEDLAARWLDYLSGPQGQQLLADHGLSPR